MDKRLFWPQVDIFLIGKSAPTGLRWWTAATSDRKRSRGVGTEPSQREGPDDPKRSRQWSESPALFISQRKRLKDEALGHFFSFSGGPSVCNAGLSGYWLAIVIGWAWNLLSQHSGDGGLPRLSNAIGAPFNGSQSASVVPRIITSPLRRRSFPLPALQPLLLHSDATDLLRSHPSSPPLPASPPSTKKEGGVGGQEAATVPFRGF